MSLTTKDGLPISPQNPLPVKVVGEQGVVIWSTSDDDTAKIEDGKIVIVGLGETKLIATVNGFDYAITLENGGD